MRLIRYYLMLAGILLLITAGAKLISSYGDTKILNTPDPVFGIPMQKLMVAVGVLELAIGIICFWSRKALWPLFSVAMLATAFVIYRLGRVWLGYKKPCDCLGNLTASLHLSPGTAEAIMIGVLAYLLIGGYVGLLWSWRRREIGAH
jgi:hypothetical protein